MLHQLYRYANDNNLQIKYGFQSDKCKWVIDLTDSGHLLTLRKDEREFPLCPKYSSNMMVAGGRAHFLLEAFNKIEGEYFIKLLEQAAEVEPLIRTVYAFLSDEKQRALLLEHRNAQKTSDSDKVTFTVGGVYPVDLISWHDWWQEHVRNESGDSLDKEGDMLCLLGGELTVPVATHGKINISRAGGISTGSVLAGFDKDAFSSYGLKASQNAAMSKNAVLTYTTALNHMIQNAAKPLGNVLILHGYDKPIAQEDDLFEILQEVGNNDDEAVRIDAQHRIKELIGSIRKGERPEYIQNSYYVILVSGASGRVMIRDYFEGDCKQLVDSFDKWFYDLSLVSPKGDGDVNGPKLAGLLTRLVSFRESDSKIFERIGDELSAFIPAIWRGILTDAPLPSVIASKALMHLRSRLLKTDNTIPDATACMWLKIWLIRGGMNMTKGLNRDEPAQAYQMGRLLAVYAKLQEDANPGINVGVGQRFFASASTTPALVLGRLATLSNHHLAKLEERRAIWYKQQLQEVASGISPNMPNVMSLKDQSLFALGYYHQMAEFYKGKSTKNEEE